MLWKPFLLKNICSFGGFCKPKCVPSTHPTTVKNRLLVINDYICMTYFICIPPGILYFAIKYSLQSVLFLGLNCINWLQSLRSISSITRFVILQIALWLTPIKKSFPTECWKPPEAKSESVAANWIFGGTVVERCPSKLSSPRT